MKGSLHLLDAPKINTKTLFFNTEEDLDKYETSLHEKESLNHFNLEKDRLENIDVVKKLINYWKYYF